MADVVEAVIGKHTLRIETGRMAKQANGSVVVRYGDTMVLATAVVDTKEKEAGDFLPLTVDYREKAYAAGRIPGGFLKRESRPGDREVLVSRLIDRTIRPLFPKGFNREIQVICLAISADKENDPEMLALIGATTALHLSDIPFHGPVSGVRVGSIQNNLVVFPSYQETRSGDLNLVVSGNGDSLAMVEGGAREFTEEKMVEAFEFAKVALHTICEMQAELHRKAAKPKLAFTPKSTDKGLKEKIVSEYSSNLKSAIQTMAKQERKDNVSGVLAEIQGKLLKEDSPSDLAKQIAEAYDEIQKEFVRDLILREKVRADGRGPTDIRPITIEVGVLPRAHGSCLFTRGETQALVSITLGTSNDEQRTDNLEGKSSKAFTLHYNFPPFSVGEVKNISGPGRREIGHGALAERAIQDILPETEKFPYTIRVVSEILESNGSSSMASVCGGTLALMDAGIPVRYPVAGVAMGLIKEGDRYEIITDILGLEDSLGDMDFKVAGSAKGITAIQMDIKITGVTQDIMKTALHQAKDARLFILKKMEEAMGEPRMDLSPYAPRIYTITVRPEKIKDIIGPGGKTIRSIVEQTGAEIDIQDSGQVLISSADEESANQAIEMINHIIQEAVIGKIYLGKVKKIMDFGAFVELFPGTEGLVHISQISDRRIRTVTEVLQEGDQVPVKVIEIDHQGKIRLSRKEAMEEGLKMGGQ